jgi:hypothetical protein
VSLLSIRAGKKAYALIQDKGLEVEDIGTVFAASGAAKWLTISALDAAIFNDWLSQAKHTLHLFGTSVGAWKLAAAAQEQPGEALKNFAYAYCHQRYDEDIDHRAIQRESDKIIASILSPEKVKQILSNSRYHFHCGAALCRGAFASESKPRLAMAMMQVNLLNLGGRRHLHRLLERVIFSDPRHAPPLKIQDGIPTRQYPLSPENFVAAISASGSIPYLMAGITDIFGTAPGMYRDGGLIDYHPVPANFWREDKLILYPHFYAHITPGWFDKSLAWRRATARQLDNVILISPSDSYVSSLPTGRIPDRQDFKRFKGRNDERIALWEQCIERGQDLAKAFMDSVNSSKLRHQIQAL